MGETQQPVHPDAAGRAVQAFAGGRIGAGAGEVRSADYEPDAGGRDGAAQGTPGRSGHTEEGGSEGEEQRCAGGPGDIAEDLRSAVSPGDYPLERQGRFIDARGR